MTRKRKTVRSTLEKANVKSGGATGAVSSASSDSPKRKQTKGRDRMRRDSEGFNRGH